MMIHMINIQDRKRKSEKLSSDEAKALKKYVATFHTIIDAAFAIGIHRNTLDMVLIKGSGSPETIHKIRERLTQTQAA
jgi:sugar diacid utilization regulator